MRSNCDGAARNKARNLKGQIGNILSLPSHFLKRHVFSLHRASLPVCLLVVSLVEAQPHAGFTIETLDLSTAGFDLKKDMGVGGLDFLSDGRMALATWGGDKKKSPKRGKVYLLSGVLEGGPIKAEQLVDGMNDNGGLVVVNDTMYVCHKEGILRVLPNGESSELVPLTWSGNYHEYHSGVVHKNGFIYTVTHQPFVSKGSFLPTPERGGFMRVRLSDGEKTFLSGGLREPNGIGIGPEGDFFASDNEGNWVPSSKIVHMDSGDYFGFENENGPFPKSVTEQKTPAIWFYHDAIASSPDQPILIPWGRYKNQMLIGDHKTCNLMRVFLEKVDGQWQGAQFVVWNSKQMSSTANRMVWGPDSALYIGGMGSVTAWGAACGWNRTIQKLTLTGKLEFEILAMRSVANGFELEFTESPGPSAMDIGSYSFRRWGQKPGRGYGAGRGAGGRKKVSVQSVEKGSEANRVTLVLSGDDLKHGEGLMASTVFELTAEGVKSASGKALREPRAWYTLNKIGPGRDPKDYIPVALKKRQGKNSPHLVVNSRSLHLQGIGEVRAKIRTLDGRVLKEIHFEGPTVLPFGPLPTGVHFLTGTLDGVPFTKKVVAAN